MASHGSKGKLWADQALVPDVLEKPLRRQLPTNPLFLRQLVDPPRAGGELKSLSPGIDEKGDLARIGPPRNFPRLEVHKVFEKAAVVIVHLRIRDLRPFLGL